MKKLLIIVLMALCSTPCFAWDGNQLLGYCEHKEDGSGSYHQSIAWCSGYISGASDTLRSTGVICLAGIKYGQVRKVVEKYLRNYPELLHHNADILVKNALVKAFPCK